jgi:nucleotide-binding universal stress UspA family protein
VVEFKNILCPIDLSDASMRLLSYAVAFARWYEARLTVLHVVPTFDTLQVRSGSLGDSVRMVYPMPREEILGELRRAVDAAGAGTLDVTLTACEWQRISSSSARMDEADSIGSCLVRCRRRCCGRRPAQF